MKRIIFLYLVIGVLTACGSLKLPPEEQAIKELKVMDKVVTGNYSIEVDQLKTFRGNTVSLSPDYKLEIHDGMAEAYLPFFGRATQAPILNDGGIQFTEKMENYRITSLEKQEGWSISFNINTIEYNYNFHLTIYNTSKSVIYITSMQRDPISFFGEIQL